MADAETLYDRVDDAIQRSEVWRAKEILRGNVRLRGYDVDLYERCGRLLLDIGETSEAGKYLFLSGRRSPNYEKAISVNLERHVPNPEHMYFTFPRAARLNDIDEYPEGVRRTLESIDFPVGVDGRLYALRGWREHREKMRASQPKVLPTRLFLPSLSFRWKMVWPRPPRGKRGTIFFLTGPSRSETIITFFVNLLLLICLVLVGWAFVEWLLE